MLRIDLPDEELWDEAKEEIIYRKGQTLCLEHSLIAVSKWEAKWKKPFLTDNEKTEEEIKDYIRCMTISQNVPDEVYETLGPNDIETIMIYVNDPMTATTFTEHSNGKSQGPRRKQILTSELIYYMMIAYNIPVEFQKWHLNRLITLLRVCQAKNEPPKKMSKSAAMSRNKAINSARKQALHTHG